ncbi:retropepsin-like aspartic protease [Azospirillum sp. Marseille-Q6669]
MALIDTGASVTCVSPRVARILGLVSQGHMQVVQLGAPATVNAYIVNFSILFPDGFLFSCPFRYVLELASLHSHDVLIGCDVLSSDPSIRVTFDGKGNFTFCV